MYSREFADDIALRRVFADEVLGHPKFGVEDAVAQLHGTANLSGPLPNNLPSCMSIAIRLLAEETHLGKVGWDGIVGIVVGWI